MTSEERGKEDGIQEWDREEKCQGEATNLQPSFFCLASCPTEEIRSPIDWLGISHSSYPSTRDYVNKVVAICSLDLMTPVVVMGKRADYDGIICQTGALPAR